MEAKFKVTLLLDVDFESDVNTFLNSLDDNRYAIEKVESLKIIENTILCESCKGECEKEYRESGTLKSIKCKDCDNQPHASGNFSYICGSDYCRCCQ